MISALGGVQFIGDIISALEEGGIMICVGIS